LAGRIMAMMSEIQEFPLFYRLFPNWTLRRLHAKAPTCEHEWEVVGTAYNQGCLELNCKQCASWANVLDPSKEEWAAAYGALDNPYPWTDLSRVNSIPSDQPMQI
jgi:hypothetical protein